LLALSSVNARLAENGATRHGVIVNSVADGVMTALVANGMNMAAAGNTVAEAAENMDTQVVKADAVAWDMNTV
jgi:hypothetical protein